MKTLPAAKSEILRRLSCLRQDSARQWGRMTPHQMICHLTDSFKTATGDYRASDASGLFQRTVMKWGGLWFPLPWPHGLPTRPEVDQVGGGGTPPAEFERDRAALCAVLERFCADPRDFEWAEHPIFGRMTDREWMRWGYLHSDHHLRQFGT